VTEGAGGRRADEWVHSALARDLDLGFELAPASVSGDAAPPARGARQPGHNSIGTRPRGATLPCAPGRGTGVRFIEIEDDGAGIPPQERERVLERFYRMPGTAGTGSGWASPFVREIAPARRGARNQHGMGGPRLPSCDNISPWIASISRSCAPPRRGASKAGRLRWAPLSRLGLRPPPSGGDGRDSDDGQVVGSVSGGCVEDDLIDK